MSMMSEELREQWSKICSHEGIGLPGCRICDPKFEGVRPANPVTSYDPKKALPSDPVNQPPHYKTPSGLEAIDVIEAFGWGFCVANAFKYLARAGKKTADPLQDLRKARWYLDREISRLEKAAAR